MASNSRGGRICIERIRLTSADGSRVFDGISKVRAPVAGYFRAGLVAMTIEITILMRIRNADRSGYGSWGGRAARRDFGGDNEKGCGKRMSLAVQPEFALLHGFEWRRIDVVPGWLTVICSLGHAWWRSAGRGGGAGISKSRVWVW